MFYSLKITFNIYLSKSEYLDIFKEANRMKMLLILNAVNGNDLEWDIKDNRNSNAPQ